MVGNLPDTITDKVILSLGGGTLAYTVRGNEPGYEARRCLVIPRSVCSTKLLTLTDGTALFLLF